jgi:hypothetical protein
MLRHLPGARGMGFEMTAAYLEWLAQALIDLLLEQRR